MSDGEAPKRLALIDRDGTIIVDKVYLSDPNGIEFAPGAIEGLRLLRDSGFTLVLMTNQSGIARGYFDLATLGRIHDRLQSMLAANELKLAAIYFCPHGPADACDCRKPAPGMATKAMRDLGFRPDEVVVIGDSDGDMGAAAAAESRGTGCRRRQGAHDRRGARISSRRLVGHVRCFHSKHASSSRYANRLTLAHEPPAASAFAVYEQAALSENHRIPKSFGLPPLPLIG